MPATQQLLQVGPGQCLVTCLQQKPTSLQAATTTLDLRAPRGRRVGIRKSVPGESQTKALGEEVLTLKTCQIY